MRVLGYKLNENKGREFSNPYQLLHARNTITMTFEVETRTTWIFATFLVKCGGTHAINKIKTRTNIHNFIRSFAKRHTAMGLDEVT